MRPYENLSIESLPGEEWRFIPGWEGYYQISNYGRVKSLHRGERIRKQHSKYDGYLLITLVKKGCFLSFSVHRLVAKAFINNPNNYPVIDHINGDRADNRVDNLRWTTILGNANNPITIKRKHGRLSPMQGRTGSLCPNSKPIRSVDEEGVEEHFWGVMEAKQLHNYDPGLIKKSLRNPRQKAYKKHWYYL